MTRDNGTPVDSEAPDSADAATVALQLGRQPRGTWAVCVRCRHGRPQVIETSPLLAGDEPFPTLYYLTCPWLIRIAGDLESAGETAIAASALARDPQLAQRMRSADTEYRARRALGAGGTDPTPGVGIAGQRDPLATKCLHAHVASALATIDDPVGLSILARFEPVCPDDLCSRLAEEPAL